MKSKQSYILNRSIQAMLIAAMLLFIAAVFGHMNTYAADIASGNCRGIDWRITEAGVLELGKIGETQMMNESSNAGVIGDENFAEYAEGAVSKELTEQDYLDMIQDRKKRNAAWEWNNHKDKITSIDIVGNIKAKGSLSGFFAEMENATSISRLGRIDTSEVTALNGLFGWDEYNPFGASFVSEEKPNIVAEHGCFKVKSINISNWDLSNVSNLSQLFANCKSLEEVDLSEVVCKPRSLEQLFNDCAELKTINFGTGIDTSECLAIPAMFRRCKALETLDLSWMDTSKVVSIQQLFRGCESLKEIKGLDGFNTSNVKNSARVFDDCKSLTKLEGLANWDTSKFDSLWNMFRNCISLQSIDDISGWDTGNVTSMQQTFIHCWALEGIADAVKDWDTGKVKSMLSTFNDCKKLSEIDLSNWNTASLESSHGMFSANPNLVTIKGLSAFDTDGNNNVSLMFQNCTNLKTPDMLGWDLKKEGRNIKDMIKGCQALAAGVQDKITAKENELKDAGKSDEEIAADPEIKAFYKAKEILEALAQNKDVEGNDLTDATAIDAIKEAAKAYSSAVIGDAKQAAEDAIAAANAAEKAAATDPTNNDKRKAAEDALREAHEAVNAVESMASNTDGTQDKNDASELRNQLENGAEKDQKERLSKELTAAVDAAKAIDTSDKSAASVRELNDAIAAAEEVLNNPNAVEAADVSKALQTLNNAKNGLENKSEDEKAYDKAKAAADKAKADADAAKAAYEAAKVKADEEIAKSPGSDASVAAAEAAKNAADAYAAAAKNAAEKADEAKNAAMQTADTTLRAEAREAATAAVTEKEAADTAKADAAVAYAEQLEKAAEIARNNGDTGKAAELEGKAAEVWNDIAKNTDNPELKARAEAEAVKKANAALSTAIAAADKIDRSKYTPESLAALDAAVEQAKKVLADPAATAEQKAAAAKAVTDAIKNLKTIDSKVGQEITVSKNVYVITKDPGATWDGEVTLKTAKNAKNVSVPKVVKHEGSSYEVNRVQAGAFRAKKIRKVTLGANIEKLDKNAFKKSKATTIVVKTKSLTKARVKGALKGSKVKTVQVKVGSKKVNKKYVKKYKKIFTKKNAGKKVTVK